MARFRLTRAFYLDNRRLKAGAFIADSNANAVAGDVVWTGLSSLTVSHAMVAVDAAGQTMLNASRFVGVPSPSIDGANSVEG